MSSKNNSKPAYPEKGGDCEFTEHCMWGVDGWCDRPSEKCILDKPKERGGTGDGKEQG